MLTSLRARGPTYTPLCCTASCARYIISLSLSLALTFVALSPHRIARKKEPMRAGLLKSKRSAFFFAGAYIYIGRRNERVMGECVTLEFMDFSRVRRYG